MCLLFSWKILHKINNNHLIIMIFNINTEVQVLNFTVLADFHLSKHGISVARWQRRAITTHTHTNYTLTPSSGHRGSFVKLKDWTKTLVSEASSQLGRTAGLQHFQPTYHHFLSFMARHHSPFWFCLPADWLNKSSASLKNVKVPFTQGIIDSDPCEGVHYYLII